MMGAQAAVLQGGRLHLQEGPIDLVIDVTGSADTRRTAYRRAMDRFDGLLAGLCEELAELRRPYPDGGLFQGVVARRMARAVSFFAQGRFITPMAAVAGAVADEILASIAAVPGVERAFVNNGGDIALMLATDQRFKVGLIDRPDRPSLFGFTELRAGDGVGGIATSGWRGRSFSLGIADAVTVLAVDAALADAAATVIANAVDCPGHPAVFRAPAETIQADSDLGAMLVTRDVEALGPDEIDAALEAGLSCARDLMAQGSILQAALHLQGETRVVARHSVAMPAFASRSGSTGSWKHLGIGGLR